MTLRLGDCSDDSRYDAWTRVVERIYREQVGHAWGHYLFRLLRAVFTTNQRLSEEGGFLFEWMVSNYVDSTLMLLRRELDLQAGTENLRNLLFDMIEHPTVVTRERYLSRWGDGSVHRLVANRVFDRFVGSPEADHAAPDVIRADLERVSTSAEHLRRYAEQTRAHRSPERRVDTAGMTFEALHEAIADVRDVIEKYYALLTQRSIAQWEPVPQYDTLGAFLGP
jgi:hypothetical protein